ncbi:MAG TPA: thiol reductant ABC exporter subunit CydD [Spirochaetia bacterium]|nr:thiol reductant ABC exporter subunit CydD [Spirochaetia bacterium]
MEGSSGWLREQAVPARRRLAATVAFGELAGILMVAQTGLLARAVDAVIFHGAGLSQIMPLVLAGMAVIAARAGFTVAARRSAFSCASVVKRELRRRSIWRLQTLGPVALAGMKAGEISHAAVDAVEALDGYFSRYLPQRAIATLLPFTILAVIFPLDWISGLVLVLTAVFLPISMIVIGDQAHERNQKLWGRLALMSGRFLDVLQGLSTVRMFGAARREAAEIERASHEHRLLTMSVLRIAFLTSFMLELISAVSIAVVAVIAGFRLLHGTLAFGSAWFILLAAPEYFLTLRALGTFYHSRMEAMSAAEQIQAFLGDDGSRPSGPGRGASRRVAGAPSLRLREVSFSYGAAPVLSRVSLDVRPGERVALTGPSGAGKSTVLALLLGFAAPGAGHVLVDEAPLSDFDLDAWRASVAWLPQRPTIFAGTVRDNLLLGRRGAAEGELHRAMDLAGIPDLPLESPVAEAGQRVSTGQAQRIALARLFLRSPSVVLLDEPAAHLDPETAARVRQSVTELARGRTTIIVTHRADAVEPTDRVIQLFREVTE